jgi:hypothetical protein
MEVGRLARRSSTKRTPGAQHWISPQSTLDTSQVEEDNDEGSLGFDHRQRGESIGTVNGAISAFSLQTKPSWPPKA